jgi:Cu(I)/Ag(I) efflux system membrane fusion protein
VALGEGRFRAAPVEVGFESGAQSEIRKGLQAGDRVVLSGQFLIDSEASLSATVARLEVTQETQKHQGRGTVTEVDAAKGRVELDHGPIPSLQWPQMKMGFLVEDKAQLAKLKKGAVVEFELRAKPDPDGNYIISKIEAKR